MKTNQSWYTKNRQYKRTRDRTPPHDASIWRGKKGDATYIKYSLGKIKDREIKCLRKKEQESARAKIVDRKQKLFKTRRKRKKRESE